MQKKSDRTPVEKLAYRVDDASKASGLGRSKLYEEIKEGRLRSVKVGGRRLILHEDLEALLKGNKDAIARPTADSGFKARRTIELELRELTPPPKKPAVPQNWRPGSDGAVDLGKKMGPS
jgi:excisionase family DNA binding protein